MERSTAALVACVLLVAATSAAPVPAGSADPKPSPRPSAPPAGAAATGPPALTNNTTARLALPSYRVTRSEFEVVRLGVGASVQAAAAGVTHQHGRLTIEQRFRRASTLEAKRTVINRALIDLDEQAEALERRERAAIRNYSEGNISADALVRELARIDAEADRIEDTLGLLRAYTERAEAPWLNFLIRGIRGKVGPLQGPVRDRAARALEGTAPPTRVFVEATDGGVVLATMVEDRYVREASYWPNRNASADPEITQAGDAFDRAAELYPWIDSLERKSPSIEARGPGVWLWTVRHPQGELTAYIDASTRDVFRETQTLTVTAMPTVQTVAHTGDGLRVTLRRTYVGGPLELLVERPSTDTVVNARVTVDGHELGFIGTDGIATTIEPRPPYSLTVTTGDATLNVTVERPFNASRAA